MTETTIITDTPTAKSGIREGWEIDVVAQYGIGADMAWGHVWITPPRRQRIALRSEQVSGADCAAFVTRGWLHAIEEIDWRIARQTGQAPA